MRVACKSVLAIPVQILGLPFYMIHRIGDFIRIILDAFRMYSQGSTME